MKKVFLLFTIAISVFAAYGQKVVFMPAWIPQSQWAGYYMALQKGFYEDEGLDVEIIHPKLNSTSSAFQLLFMGKADIIAGHLASALKLRTKGYPITNVLQTSQRSSLCCITRYRVDSIQQLRNLTIARWKSEYGDSFDMINRDYSLDINWVPFIRDVNLFVYGAVDGILAYRYSEYVALVTSLGSINPKCVINAADYGYDYPEDGLYVSDYYLAKNRQTVVKFVRASMRGWEYARNHKDETLKYILDYMHENNIQTNSYAQKEMLRIVIEFQKDPITGDIDFSPISIDKFYHLCDNLKKIGRLPSSVKYSDFIKDLRPQH